MKQVNTRMLVVWVWCLMGHAFAAALPLSHWTLSPNAIGPVTIGMTLKQAEKVSGLRFQSTVPDPGQAEDKSCFYVFFKGEDNLSFMVSEDKIVRIDVTSSAFPTSVGAKVGDTDAQVLALYPGKLQVTPHHYNPKGHYLTLFDKAHDRAIRFETNGKTVTVIYGGRTQEVNDVEGCL